MNSLEMFEQISKDVIPLASENIKNYFNIENNNEIFVDDVTKHILFLILEKYINLLLNCNNLIKLFKLIDIEKISDYDNYTLIYSKDAHSLLIAINSLKGTDYTLDTPNIRFYLIKWSFLSFFEDLFYLTSYSLPLNIPQYYEYLVSIYQQNEINEEIENLNLDKLSISIDIVFEKNKKILFKKKISLFVESSTLEGIYIAGYYYNKLFNISSCSQYKLVLYFNDKEIDYVKYVKSKNILRIKEFENEYTKYSGVISPLGKIVNYEKETFVEGFDLISSILEDTPFHLQIMYNVDNDPIQIADYVKT